MPANDATESSVHPDLAAQMALYETPRIITTLGHIHTAHCYTGSNCTLIVGEDGCVLVDTLSGELPGDEAAAAWAASLVERLEGTVLRLSEDDLPAYHAGAVMASNALAAAIDA